MMMVDNKKVVHVLVPVLLAVAMNGVIWRMGWGSRGETGMMKSEYLPPGWVIGGVWMVLFGFLGWTHWLVRKDWKARTALQILIAYCLMYPVLTGGLRERLGRLFNVVALILSYVATMFVVMGRHDLRWMLPLLAWVSYVNVTDAIPDA